VDHLLLAARQIGQRAEVAEDQRLDGRALEAADDEEAEVAGVGQPLAGRMVVCDLRSMAFRVMTVRRDPACLVCGGGFRG